MGCGVENGILLLQPHEALVRTPHVGVSRPPGPVPPHPPVPENKVAAHLDPGPGQVHVGLPLGLHLPVLRRLRVDELLAVRGVQLPGDGALKGLRGAGAVQGVRPADGGVPAGKTKGN